MKFSFVSATAALVMMATLAGCGGKAQYTVQGTILNLNNSGLVLTNNGDELTVPSGATTFAFSKQISYGTDYNILVKTQPAHMTCSWQTVNSGSAGYNVSISATLSCSQNTYTIGGQITGLTAAADGTVRTVTLANGSAGGSVALLSSAATNGALDFTFSTLVADGQTYGVTVVDPANGLSCTVTNGTGVMHETAVSNILVTCK
jgi:hypothetical protein